MDNCRPFGRFSYYSIIDKFWKTDRPSFHILTEKIFLKTVDIAAKVCYNYI
jgi:hypothetical protein